MNRWIHGLFAFVALSVIVVLVALWPQPAELTPPAATRSGSGGALTVPTDLPPSLPPAQSTGPGGTITPCPGPRPAGRLSVLTFNIHGALTRTGYDLARIAAEIEAWDADVVLLQEVDRHRLRTAFDDQPGSLAARLDLNVVFGRNVVRRPATAGQPQQEYGTAILSRRPIRSWRNVLLPNQPGLEQRGLLRVTVRAAGQWVDIYNTHLQHTPGNIRIVQVRAIRHLVARDPRPHLVGGDLNATPDSPALAVAGTFLRDPWPVVGSGAGRTVPARVPQRRVDYVLHDENWVPTAAQTLVSAVSDHRALRVEFTLLGPRGCD